MKVIEFDDIKGKVIKTITGAEQYSAKVIFTFTDGSSFVMKHERESCEYFAVEDIFGDVDDLIGSPLLMAEIVTGGIWSFAKFATFNGYVTFEWEKM